MVLEEPSENYITGYIKLYRSLKDHWLWKDNSKKSMLEAWLDILFRANHKDLKEPIGYDLVILKRGQLLTSQERLAIEWRWERTAVRRFIKMLEKDKMISVETSSKFTIITVCKYGDYQVGAPNKRPTNAQQTPTDKNVKNDKNNRDTNVSLGKIDFADTYKDVPKDIESITKFINSVRPTIIEPYVDLWNLFSDKFGCAMVKKPTDSRKKKLRVRLNDKNFSFTNILREAKTQELALEGSWFTFDWLIANDTNYVKVLEGKYRRKPNGTNTGQPEAFFHSKAE